MTQTPGNTGLDALPTVGKCREVPSTAHTSPRQQPVGLPGGSARELWLAAKAETTRRQAREDTCPRCDQTILIGPDHDICAAQARVDPQPVDRLHETAALLTGRHSYDLVHGELHYREPHHIHTAKQKWPIHLSHECDNGKATLW